MRTASVSQAVIITNDSFLMAYSASSHHLKGSIFAASFPLGPELANVGILLSPVHQHSSDYRKDDLHGYQFKNKNTTISPILYLEDTRSNSPCGCVNSPTVPDRITLSPPILASKFWLMIPCKLRHPQGFVSWLLHLLSSFLLVAWESS